MTLGLLLHKHSIPFTIFELRPAPTNSDLAKPSGMLDLHDESGLAAIRECGLFDEFLKLTGECAEAQKVSDKDGNILYTDDGELSERPEISRHALTGLLISHLPTDSIKWSHKLLSATRCTSSDRPEVTLDFGPQGRHVFDLVIGADGAWSRVRNLLTDVRPHYEGIQIITLTIQHITNKYPHLAALVGLGSFSALGLRHGVMSQRGPHDSARIYVFLTIEDENFPTTSGLAGQTAAAAKDKLLGDDALLGRWGPTMKELVTVACDEDTADNPGAMVDIKPMYALPSGESWDHQAGLTLIGDSAHLMLPFAGEGVNLAMWDSLLLARAISKAYETGGQDATTFQSALDPLLSEFEVDMAARAKEKAEESESNGRMLFGEDGAKDFVRFFEAAYGMRPE